MKKRSSGNMPQTEQRRYPQPCSDLGETNAIPYWQPVLVTGELRRNPPSIQPIDGNSIIVPSTMTYTSTSRKAD